MNVLEKKVMKHLEDVFVAASSYTPGSSEPSSIISLASHCSKPPDPDPDLVSSTTGEEVDLKLWIAEFREQLRIDRTKIFHELRQDFSLLKKI